LHPARYPPPKNYPHIKIYACHLTKIFVRLTKDFVIFEGDLP
jgi:hypothetical protein